jgi:hypothetical protein
MTDRTLPHLFPSSDEVVFRATLDQAIGIEQPPPMAFFSAVGTTLAALSAVQSRGFFAPSAMHRALVVFTDGETRAFDAAALGTVLRREPAIRPVFVHLGNARERVYTNGVAEPDYRPDPKSGAHLDRIAQAAGGDFVEEGRVDALARSVRSILGTGASATETRTRDEFALGPYLIVLAALPLLFLLVRLSR